MENPLWKITIPNWIPKSDNKFKHWSDRYAGSNEAGDLLAVYANNEGIPRISGGYRPVRFMTMRVSTAKRGRLPDPSNMLKCLLDGMVRAKLIVDDSYEWCKWTMPIVERATADRWGTVITIIDIDSYPRAFFSFGATWS
jgi:hypothetical protein